MVRTVQFNERRRYRRLDTHGTAIAVHRAAVAKLNLSDLSDGGLSAVCPVQMRVASPVTVLLPPDQSLWRLPPARPGHVVRCRPLAQGFQVAVAFDSPLTVA
ncbi:MAG: PilZ domain-containing protein [Phycisphaerae bacterium]|nr:PilZ domain-containing protein [Phycisphaerae bacterium]